MDWKETLRTIKANYSKKHLVHYNLKRKWYIRFANTWITLRALLFAIYGWVKGVYPNSRKYQKEEHIFKAWFCETWIIEMNKW